MLQSIRLTFGRLIPVHSNAVAPLPASAQATAPGRHIAVQIDTSQQAWGPTTSHRALARAASEREAVDPQTTRELSTRQCACLALGAILGSAVGAVVGGVVSVTAPGDADQNHFPTSAAIVAGAFAGAMLGCCAAACTWSRLDAD